MIKIFNENDRNFDTNGNITIKPIKCKEVHKKSLNGWYIEVEVPVKYKEYIVQDKLCVVKTKSKIRPQAFRINNPKVTNNVISFTAEHVMFDSRKLFLVDVRPTNETAQNALSNINGRTDKKSPFSIFSDVDTQSTAYFIRKSLLEAWTVIEERWGGVFDADNWDIRFLKKVGNDNGETISYTKNMQGIEIFEDWSEVCTKIYPVGPDELMLPEEFLESDIQYTTPYTRTITFNSELEFEEEISEEDKKEKLLEELRENAKKYLEENKYPKVSYEISSNINQNMEIGDSIHVKHPSVNILTEVLEYEYNALTNKIEVLNFGNYTRDVKSKFDSLKENINNFSEEMRKGFNKRDIAIKEQTDLINSLNKLGLVYIDDNEILILDKIPKEEAKNVWRFGLGGIGFSSNGYEGPFEVAMTMDGQINANFITTGVLSVERIEGLQNTLNDFLVKIELNEDNIKSVVETQKEVEEKFDNLEFGGTQILRGTNTMTSIQNGGTADWALAKWRTASAGAATITVINVTDCPNGLVKKGFRLNVTTSPKDTCQDRVPVIAGEEYTMSCYARLVSGDIHLKLQYGIGGEGGYPTKNYALTEKWKKFSWTFTPKENQVSNNNADYTYTNIYFGNAVKNTDTAIYEICGMKLERGNKTTDWSESPEDIEDKMRDIDGKFTNYYTKSEANSVIDQKANEITQSVNESFKSYYTSKDIDGKFSNYTTTKDMNSIIDQKSDSITQSVNKSITETKTELEGQIDNINIGGTQILRGTNTFTSLGSSSSWSNSTWRKAGNGSGTKTAISVTDSPNANIKRGARIIINNMGDNLICQNGVPILKGEEYTISCYARLVSGTGNIKFQYGQSDFLQKAYTLTNTWKRYSWTFTSSTEADYYNTNGQTNIYFGNSTASDGTLEICGMKLEKGNKATDWSEAPEDIEDKFGNIDGKFLNYYTKTEANSVIDQKADSITEEVNKYTDTKFDGLTENLANLDIGGRNLLKQTAYENMDGVNIRGSYATATVDTGNVYNGNNSLKVVASAAAVSGTKDIWQKCWSNQVVGRKVKLSMFIKGSVAAKAWFRLGGSTSSIAPTTGTFNVTTSWTKLEIDLGEVKTAGTAGSTEIIYGFDKAGTFYINSMKLEYGDKYTEWMPAPEDTDSKFTNYYTKEQANTQITTEAGKIKTELTSEYKSYLSTLQIGSTQILRGTNTFSGGITGSGQWSKGTWRTASEGTATKTIINVTDAPNGNIKKGVRIDCTKTPADICQDNVPVVEGETYTMSCYARLVSGTDVNVKLQYGVVGGYSTTAIAITDKKWVKLSKTFTVGETNHTNGKCNIYFGVTHAVGIVEVCGLKLEKGNFATDWSESPEDVEGQINDVNSKFSSYSTTSQVQALIEQSPMGTTEKYNSLLEKTKTQVTDGLAELVIGGTQILRGTNTFTTLGSSSDWSNSTWRKAGNGSGTKTAISVTDSPNANIKRGARIIINNMGDNLICQNGVPILKGEEYTISCYARLVSGTGNIKFQYGQSDFLQKAYTLTNTWKRYSWTFTSSTEADYYNTNGQTNIYFGNSTASDGTLEVCGMKLEKGSKATDWSEAPEDIEGKFTNYYTKDEVITEFTRENGTIDMWVKENIETSMSTMTIGGTQILRGTNTIEELKGRSRQWRMV